jgi:hypothetical protein
MGTAAGWFTDRTGARYVRVPLGGDKRKAARLVTCTTDDEADRRASVVRSLAKTLRAAGKDAHVEKVVDEAAAADEERLKKIVRIVAGIAKGIERPAEAASALGVTWLDVAKRWSSGELHKLYPDRVPRKRSVGMDRSRIDALESLIGHVLIADPAWIDHAEDAMRRLPDRVQTSSTRRQYAQCIRRVLELAVLPLRLIPSNPLPRGFLPKIKQERALQMPYPDEDALLMAAAPSDDSPGVPLVRRLAYGFLARMGFRKSEIIGGVEEEGYEDEDVEPAPPLTWDRLDLDRGVVFRSRSKTDIAVPIVLDPSVTRALAAWKKLRPPARPNAEVFRDERGVIELSTKDYRAALAIAGAKRPELFKKTKESYPVRVHDLRALFVTTSLANGRPESWVRDRTSHRTITMLDRYRRQARLFAELSLGDLKPLDEAIPELRETGRGPADDVPNGRQPLRTVSESPEESGSSRQLATSGQSFGSSYYGSNPYVGTSTYAVGAPSSAGPSAGDAVTKALEAGLDAARAERRWTDVARLARELDALAERESAGVVDLARRRGKR